MGHLDVEDEELTQLRDLAIDPTVEHAVAVVREFLGMDVVYTTSITSTTQTFETLDGDAESFGIEQGGEMDIEDTYCQRVLTGRLPNVIPDVKYDSRSASLPITDAADVGAFVSVPLRLSDGSVSGTLCAASHETRPELSYRDLQFLHVFARLIADQIERRALEEEKRDFQQQAAAAQALFTAVATRDSYTGEHSRTVVNHAVAVARALDLTEVEVSEVEKVALLHDIGKIGIPDEILRKAGPLTDAEWETMRRHPIMSERLISQVDGLEHLAPALRAEHERWDGAGYPDGLAGDEIPIASRITLVCDAYDAMTTDRPYRKALSAAAARKEIELGLGTQFCPRAAATLLKILALADG